VPRRRLCGLALARPLGGCTRHGRGRADRAVRRERVRIDNSLSAAYEAAHAAVPGTDGQPLPPAKTHLDQQKLMAKRLIDTLSTGGESVAVVTAARPATAVIARPGTTCPRPRRSSTGSSSRTPAPTWPARWRS
jgi:hypothetical protein